MIIRLTSNMWKLYTFQKPWVNKKTQAEVKKYLKTKKTKQELIEPIGCDKSMAK